MMKACAVSAVPSGVLPTVISPLGLVPKPNSDKLLLVVNMKYVNEHIARRNFKFKSLLDVSDMIEKTIIVSRTTLRRAIIMCFFTQIHDVLLVLIGRELVINIIAFPLVCLQPLGCFQKSFVNLLCIGEPKALT
jgi:hypothetical protein